MLGVTVGVARAAGVNPDQPIRLDGMEIFFAMPNQSPYEIVVNVRLAQREEGDAHAEFRDVYARYKASTPAFSPTLGGAPQRTP